MLKGRRKTLKKISAYKKANKCFQMRRGGNLSPLTLKRDKIKEDLHLKPKKNKQPTLFRYKSPVREKCKN